MNKYWIERDIRAHMKLTNTNIKKTNKELEKYYKSAMNNVMADFVSTYEKLLKTAEEGKEPTPADLYKLDKYWQSQAKLAKTLEKLGNKEAQILSKNFMQEWDEIYRVFALKDYLGFGEVDEKAAKQIINSIWCADGKTWSQRVWNNTAKLKEALNTSLIDCVITGKQTSDLKKQLQYQFGVDFHRANTIVRTEMAHIQNEAARKRYEDAGVKYVRVLADGGCSDCAKLHNEKISIYDTANLPPYHPNCRCSIIPVME